jgi:hypothetical protein
LEALESFAVTSDAEIVDNPRWFGTAQKKLRVVQRHVPLQQAVSARSLAQANNIKLIDGHDLKDFAALSRAIRAAFPKRGLSA